MGQTEWAADAQVKLALTALRQGDAPEAQRLLAESVDTFRECESDAGMLWALEVFAHLAAQSDDPERAATLLGATDARHCGGAFLLEGRERLEKELHDELGNQRFEAARDQGRAMELEEAVEYALVGQIET
jgi:hypothetical protein